MDYGLKSTLKVRTIYLKVLKLSISINMQDKICSMQRKMFGKTVPYSEKWTWIYFPWFFPNINGTVNERSGFPVA